MGNKSVPIRSLLLHLGTRMWSDRPEDNPDILQFDEPVYRAVTERMAGIGMNMVVLDIGEALSYPSHPELAIRGSWSPEKMEGEVGRLRKMGLEPIPKLNFSACHDHWLGEYARMLSTPAYYRVCADVIRDVASVFGKFRFFHIGFDEEAIGEQPNRLYAAARQGELWWHDLQWLLDMIGETGARPWMWADAFWHKPEEFARRVPRSVLQSNWYYGRTFSEDGPFERGYEKVRLLAYGELDRLGYEQVPCATNWVPSYYGTERNLVNYPLTVDYCRRVLSPSRLKGFMIAPWASTQEKNLGKLMEALDLAQGAQCCAGLAKDGEMRGYA